MKQSFEGDKKVCMAITLPLAERMIKKFVDENKIEAEAEVQLYLMILEREVIETLHKNNKNTVFLQMSI